MIASEFDYTTDELVHLVQRICVVNVNVIVVEETMGNETERDRSDRHLRVVETGAKHGFAGENERAYMKDQGSGTEKVSDRAEVS